MAHAGPSDFSRLSPQVIASAEAAVANIPDSERLHYNKIESLLRFREHLCPRIKQKGKCWAGYRCTFAHSEADLLAGMAPEARLQEAVSYMRGEGKYQWSRQQAPEPMRWYPVDADGERQQCASTPDRESIPGSSCSSPSRPSNLASRSKWGPMQAVHGTDEYEEHWQIESPPSRLSASAALYESSPEAASPAGPSGQYRSRADLWQNWPSASYGYGSRSGQPDSYWADEASMWQSQMEHYSSWQSSSPSRAAEEWYSPPSDWPERIGPAPQEEEKESLQVPPARRPRESKPTPTHGRTNILDEKRTQILDWIDKHDICFIEAATGMGKSTRIPQYVVDHDPDSCVWQLQPRRLAATRLAQYIVNERTDLGPLGDVVGYRVRGDVKATRDTRLVYMTTGYFLHFVLHHLRRLDRTTSNSNWAGHQAWCTHLFIDEVHEASEETELVLLLVRMLARRGALNFKVVILSATLDFQTLHAYFNKSVLPEGVMQIDEEQPKGAAQGEEEQKSASAEAALPTTGDAPVSVSAEAALPTVGEAPLSVSAAPAEEEGECLNETVDAAQEHEADAHPSTSQAVASAQSDAKELEAFVDVPATPPVVEEELLDWVHVGEASASSDVPAAGASAEVAAGVDSHSSDTCAEVVVDSVCSVPTEQGIAVAPEVDVAPQDDFVPQGDEAPTDAGVSVVATLNDQASIAAMPAEEASMAAMPAEEEPAAECDSAGQSLAVASTSDTAKQAAGDERETLEEWPTASCEKATSLGEPEGCEVQPTVEQSSHDQVLEASVDSELPMASAADEASTTEQPVENELQHVLAKQRCKVDADGEFWESKPNSGKASPQVVEEATEESAGTGKLVAEAAAVEIEYVVEKLKMEQEATSRSSQDAEDADKTCILEIREPELAQPPVEHVHEDDDVDTGSDLPKPVPLDSEVPKTGLEQEAEDRQEEEEDAEEDRDGADRAETSQQPASLADARNADRPDDGSGAPECIVDSAPASAEPATKDEEIAEKPMECVTLEIVEEREESLGVKFSESWSVLYVRQTGCVFGRMQPGDCLVAVNGSPVSDQEWTDVLRTLDARPVKLRFVRQVPEPPRIAEETLSLAEDTPYSLTIRYLDKLTDIPGWSTLGLAPEIPFSVAKHKQGLGPEPSLMEVGATLLLHLCRSSDECALVFLPGMTEIEHFIKVLDRKMADQHRMVDVVILHSITLTEKCEVRRPSGSPHPTAYIASSIAETSITLPELSVVFDFGLSRGMVFDPVLDMEQLTTKEASKTSGKQRAGRVGRTKPGQVYRLYPEAVWEGMPQNDSWGGTGAQRCLESLVLLVTKTLVRYLGLNIRTCLSLMVQPPTQAEVDNVLERLEELDAIKATSGGNHTLTAFGEFAVCIAVLGPRLARLVYCGIIFDCTRLALVLAAVHSVCGKTEIWQVPHNLRGGRDEDVLDAGPPQEVLQEFSRTFGEEGPLGMILSPEGMNEKALRVKMVKEGSLGQAAGVKAGDQVLAINGIPLAPNVIKKISPMLSNRPCTLRFSRIVLQDPLKTEEPAMNRRTLNHLINIARSSTEMDGGTLSEPISALRLFDMYLGKKLKSDLVSLHRLRQIESVTREVGQKLRQFLQHSRHRQSSPRGRWNSYNSQGRKKFVLSRLDEDQDFLRIDFEKQLSILGRPIRHTFLASCFEARQLSRFRLVLCAAFPSNFLIGSLKPKPEKAKAGEADKSQPPGETPPTSPSAFADARVAPPPPCPPSLLDVTGVPQALLPPGLKESLADPEVPPMTIRNAGNQFTAKDVAERLHRTFAMQGQPKVEQVSGQPPGNFMVVFPPPRKSPWHDLYEEPDGIARITNLADACLVNILSQRDTRSRLHLLCPQKDDVEDRRAPEVCGEFHLVPAFELRLLRLPSLVVRPAARVTPLSRVAPLPGIGGKLPAQGPGADGHCVAVSVELEATKLNLRDGKKVRMGKGIRSWLVSWLPSTDAFDLVSLILFWPREIGFVEDVTCLTCTAFSRLTFGNGLAINFPEGSPLSHASFVELQDMHAEVQRALRTGQMYEDYLPCVEKLRDWGRKNLEKAKLDNELPAEATAEKASYTHSRGFGFVTESEAPNRELVPKFVDPILEQEPPAATEAQHESRVLVRSVPMACTHRGKAHRRTVQEVKTRVTNFRAGKGDWKSLPGDPPRAADFSSPWSWGCAPPSSLECVVEDPAWVGGETEEEQADPVEPVQANFWTEHTASDGHRDFSNQVTQQQHHDFAEDAVETAPIQPSQIEAASADHVEAVEALPKTQPLLPLPLETAPPPAEPQDSDAFPDSTVTESWNAE